MGATHPAYGCSVTGPPGLPEVLPGGRERHAATARDRCPVPGSPAIDVNGYRRDKTPPRIAPYNANAEPKARKAAELVALAMVCAQGGHPQILALGETIDCSMIPDGYGEMFHNQGYANGRLVPGSPWGARARVNPFGFVREEAGAPPPPPPRKKTVVLAQSM